MNLRAIVGRNIRRRREMLDVSQEDIALSAGIDLKYYGQIERGNRNPSLKKIENIAEALNIADTDLFKT
jgi:transcriptional regulator with XRE-family HTH domain